MSTVIRFVEKPRATRAQRLIEGGALWNAFIIAARATALLELFETRIPHDSLLMYAHRSWVKGWTLFPSGNWYFYPVEKRA